MKVEGATQGDTDATLEAPSSNLCLAGFAPDRRQLFVRSVAVSVAVEKMAGLSFQPMGKTKKMRV